MKVKERELKSIILHFVTEATLQNSTKIDIWESKLKVIGRIGFATYMKLKSNSVSKAGRIQIQGMSR